MKHMTPPHLLLTIIIRSLPGLADGGNWLELRKCHQPCIQDLQLDTGIESVVTAIPYHPECSSTPPVSDCAQSYLFYVNYDEDLNKSVILSKGMTGSILSWSSWLTGWDGPKAFDGHTGTSFHSAKEQESWLKGDLGNVHIIVGAYLTARNTHAFQTENLHFLVAVTDEDLDDYSRSLCHVYPGPPLTTSQVEWLPCHPAREGRFFKVMMILEDHINYLQIAELDVYGYLLSS